MTTEKLFIYLFAIQSAILAGTPILGNLLAWFLRATNHPSAAARVDRMIPIALRLGMAKTAKDIADVGVELAHEVTTKVPNEAAGVTPGATAIVKVELDPNPTPGAAPAQSIVLPIVGGMLFALIAFGCGPLPPEVLEALGQSDSRARQAYAVALDACPDADCDAKVREAFASVRAFGDRDAWSEIDREHDAKRPPASQAGK